MLICNQSISKRDSTNVETRNDSDMMVTYSFSKYVEACRKIQSDVVALFSFGLLGCLTRHRPSPSSVLAPSLYIHFFPSLFRSFRCLAAAATTTVAASAVAACCLRHNANTYVLSLCVPSAKPSSYSHSFCEAPVVLGSSVR